MERDRGTEVVSRRGLVGRLGLLAGGPEDPRGSTEADRPWHDPAGGFRNPPGSPVPAGTPAEWRRFIGRRILGRTPAPELPAGHVRPESAVLADLRAQGDRDGVTWLGHSCWLIRLGGRTLITDPFLADYASPLRGLGPRRFAPPGLPVGRLPPIELVLLSHNHYDHLDRWTLDAIGARDRPVLVTALGVASYVLRRGFREIHELDWHGRASVLGLEITAMPAIHFSKRGLRDRNRSLWCGFRVGDGRHSIHFVGDTAYGPVFGELGQLYAPPDLALVPIGAYEPRPLMQGSHCTPEEAVMIGRDLCAARLAAMHWGTIRLTDEPPFEPAPRFSAAAREGAYERDAALVPVIGETVPL